jgi:hypothetical protein
MPSPPAACARCGAIFPFRGIVVENSTNVTFGSLTVQCPSCGGPARVLDGTYDFVGNTIRLVDGPAYTRAQLTALMGLLKKARDERRTAEELEAEIEKAAPGFANVAELIRPKTSGDIAAWVVVLLGFLQFLLAMLGSGDKPIQINEQVINQFFMSATGDASQDSSGRNLDRGDDSRSAVGRNDPCPCGSGKKFKKCHGDPARH